MDLAKLKEQDNLARGSSNGFEDNSKMSGGWIINSYSDLLFWVPPIYQKALRRPCNVAVIGKNSIGLDLSQFVHGTSWSQCRA
jgi:hypothetical protein